MTQNSIFSTVKEKKRNFTIKNIPLTTTQRDPDRELTMIYDVYEPSALTGAYLRDFNMTGQFRFENCKRDQRLKEYSNYF